jgi:hypothetical protein
VLEGRRQVQPGVNNSAYFPQLFFSKLYYSLCIRHLTGYRVCVRQVEEEGQVSVCSTSLFLLNKNSWGWGIGRQVFFPKYKSDDLMLFWKKRAGAHIHTDTHNIVPKRGVMDLWWMCMSIIESPVFDPTPFITPERAALASCVHIAPI